MLVQNSLSEVLRAREELFTRTIWTDPTSQLQNRVKGSELSRYFLLTKSERIGIEQTIRLLVSTTPYYLSLSDPTDPNCPIRRMIVPTAEEAVFSLEESSDPLDEERLSPVRGLTHMYPNRVLLFSNHSCSVYCRHCMRGRKVSSSGERMEKTDLETAFDYIRNHPEVEDVVVSGGDPLNLADARLEWILQELNQIPHVRICRLGTRNPVTLPFRITDNLCKIIERYNDDNLSIFCHTQFNHPKECTKEAKDAILRLLKVGVSVGNQAVLLKGINDDEEIMLTLHKRLLEMRVRAYYLYDPELIPGSRGFRTPLARGIEIVEYMRGKIGGMGIPHFVNDLPGGGGKITIGANWYLGYYPKTRQHAFRSAVTKKIHFSFEPVGSDKESYYPVLSEADWEKFQAE
ncbi:KamA family radical SAM protein [Leptospira levettii]|uniref:KamA family radical SAM protein n=1 Tax=Leptospira levettii TaxID=2023178 RepID=A0AAW5VBU5_9LEPT|nr:KamA family radical SAM protein [Leptospira levettii]MCW7466439.1 KamA family radical SAM protein [Leptospira levettii]MCW7511995.1 KamA family radical SAM protein [Leptospira levettii]MCW7515755.1 KamA family radical SAM protein [Leptospira levettii]